MRVLALNHINIAGTPDLIARCRSFYVDVLGLTEGHRPPFRSRGFWLYADGQPVVHLTERDSKQNGGSAFNHFAFTCDGLETATAILEKHAVSFKVDEVPLSKQTQIFLTDPAGVAIELNFSTP
jgi:catechol 2,3-dioxygenase-like lactoylglutathione lyase family enzyme